MSYFLKRIWPVIFFLSLQWDVRLLDTHGSGAIPVNRALELFRLTAVGNNIVAEDELCVERVVLERTFIALLLGNRVLCSQLMLGTPSTPTLRRYHDTYTKP